MPSPLWLEYRLESLTFFDGVRLNFSGACRMLYDTGIPLLAIEPGNAADRAALNSLGLKRGETYPSELRRIEYAMIIDLPEGRDTVRFFHPLGKGSGVRIEKFEDVNGYFFANDNYGQLFTKDRRVIDVTNGGINSDRAVWQFHGYKHAH